MLTPIELTLYNEEDEAIKTLSRSVVNWGCLKKAVKLSNELQTGEDLSEEKLDKITNFVVYLFGNKATKEEIEEGADISEIMSCFRAVVRRASALGNV